MKKNACKMFSVLMAGMLLCGCEMAEIPEMTEQEAELITEYATNLVVKHSAISDRNLLSATELENGIYEEAQAKELKLKADEIAKSYLGKDANKNKAQEEMDTDGEGGEESAAPSATVSDFFEMSDFDIEYTSYQLCAFYPEEDSDEFFVAMDATPGKQLCVVKFDVKNMSASEQEFDMFSKKGRFTLLVDGEKISAQSTMLLNDLSSFRGSMAADESKEMVLVFEVDQDLVQMESVKLVMKNEAGENTIVLN